MMRTYITASGGLIFT